MIKRLQKVKVRPLESSRALQLIVREKALITLGNALRHARGAQTGSITVVRITSRQSDRGVKIFMGPSVEGPDVEYVEIVSGKVSGRKPSFVR